MAGTDPNRMLGGLTVGNSLWHFRIATMGSNIEAGDLVAKVIVPVGIFSLVSRYVFT